MPSGTIDQTNELVRVIWQSERQEIGELLQRRRLRLGYSQARMAELVGVHQSQISRFERAETTPKNYQTAMAIAKCYNLSRNETEQWMHLFSMDHAEMADVEYGLWLVSAERLVHTVQGLLQTNSSADAYDYFAPLSHLHSYAELDAMWDDLRTTIDFLVGGQPGIFSSYLLIELGGALVHYLDARGDYARRIALSRSASLAAERLQRRTIQGWLYGDTIPYTFILQFHDPESARAFLLKGREIAIQTDQRDLSILIDGYWAWTELLLGNTNVARRQIQRLIGLDCSPTVRARNYLVAGEVAFVSSEYHEALAYFTQAVSLAHSSRLRPGRTDLRLAQCYLVLGEYARAESLFAETLGELQKVGNPPYESYLALSGLAKIARIKGDVESEKRYEHDGNVLAHLLLNRSPSAVYFG